MINVHNDRIFFHAAKTVSKTILTLSIKYKKRIIPLSRASLNSRGNRMARNDCELSSVITSGETDSTSAL